MFILFAIATLAALTGCQDIDTKVLIGGTCLPSSGAAPIGDCIIVTSHSTIVAVGVRKDVPVPQNSERTSLDGKWILPAGKGVLAPGQPADLAIYDSPEPRGTPVRSMAAGKWNPAGGK
ncbi:MAG TPA: hypothetical protein VNH18_13335 [Bryobacteraceae bacterium]|nr:hypothetical protein [Bryobacteraceae bacterium]